MQIQTPKNKFKVEVFSKFVEKEEIKTEKCLFEKMCKDGCINYNKKYSCPPFSPIFEDIIKYKEGLFVVLFKCKLNQINSTEYNKTRIANVVMKSRIEKLMRYLEKEFGTVFLSTGSCRLCKPCKLKIKQACKHPEERRYSLESTGVDCNNLTEYLFNIKLLWYKDKKSPEYTCVVCGLLVNKKDSEKVINTMNSFLSNETQH